MLYMTTDHRIAVRLTKLARPIPFRAEILEAVSRRGLKYDRDAGRWYATQAELDTPHAAFTIRPL